MKVYLLCLIILLFSSVAQAGSYSLSAHGDNSIGVERSALSTLGYGYAIGNCAHCHEMHASIGGDEPDPKGGSPSIYTLFSTNYTDQDTAFCFDCHQDGWGSYQDSTSRRTNYSYSYLFGGDTSITCPDSILEAFSFIDESGNPVSNCGSDHGSSHKLTDILNFITGKWGYTNDSNPCCGCHNPHAAKVPPSTTTASSPISLPSAHANKYTWGIYSDTMSDYIIAYGGTYQPPNKAGGGTELDATKLPDYVTFCTDCHNTSNTIYSYVLKRYLLTTIDWTNETHGRGNGSAVLASPYTSGGHYVLACTDCHEPHGSPNILLTRKNVNAGSVSVSTGLDNQWDSLCGKCHVSIFASHHIGELYEPICSSCHPMPPTYQTCTFCHYHGSTFTYGTYNNYPLF